MKLYCIKFFDEEEPYLYSNDIGFLEECIMDLVEEWAYHDWLYEIANPINPIYSKYQLNDVKYANECWYYAKLDTNKYINIEEVPICFIPEVIKTETNIYNKSTVYTNCTVEIWENTVTGETSVGWYKTEDTEEICTS